MTRKVVLITGASSGIGRVTAEMFLDKGYIVYGAARSEEKLKYLDKYSDGHYQIMDITDPVMRSKCVEQILNEEGRIDILINNAGYGSFGAVEEVSQDEAKRQFEVNLFGLSEITKLVIPVMRENHSGKIINISSVGGKVWTPLGGWYHASKFALEGLSDCLRNELRDFGIDVVLIEPGAIKSNWADITAHNLLEVSGAGPYQKQARRSAEKYKEMYAEGGIAAESETVAAVIIKAAEKSNPKARYVVPAHAKAMLFFRWLLPDSVYDYFTRKFF
jgi:short-subunit dehydrogenase